MSLSKSQLPHPADYSLSGSLARSSGTCTISPLEMCSFPSSPSQLMVPPRCLVPASGTCPWGLSLSLTPYIQRVSKSHRRLFQRDLCTSSAAGILIHRDLSLEFLQQSPSFRVAPVKSPDNGQSESCDAIKTEIELSHSPA